MLSAAPTLLINSFLLVNKSLLLLLVNLAPIKLGWWVVFFFFSYETRHQRGTNQSFPSLENKYQISL